MRCGEQAFAVGPGAYVALPHGVPHTFRVVGDEPAVMLQVHADDSFLRFIRAAGRPAADRGRRLGHESSGHDGRVPAQTESGGRGYSSSAPASAGTSTE